MLNRAGRLLLLTVGTSVALAGCSGAAGTPSDGRLTVVASIYPLQYVVEQVGGDAIAVSTVTPAGADPHAVELSPRQLRTFGDADAVVYLSGFQPAVDEAIADRAPEHVLDVAAAADLRPLAAGAVDENGNQPSSGTLDPHFWLDPTRLAAVAHEVARLLGEVDPVNAATYAANADTLDADLVSLDTEFASGLADCTGDTVVTSHASLGYLTQRYGLRQVAVSGLNPEGEPSPARMREVRAEIERYGVSTVFTEPLADPAVAATLSADLGVEVGQLDPLDSHADTAADYRDVMHANLDALRAGLGCS